MVSALECISYISPLWLDSTVKNQFLRLMMQWILPLQITYGGFMVGLKHFHVYIKVYLELRGVILSNSTMTLHHSWQCKLHSCLLSLRNQVQGFPLHNL